MPDHDPDHSPTPLSNKRTSPPKRQKNSAVRSREYLTPDEVNKLVEAAGHTGRHQLRDTTLILVSYRHALRVSELVALRWDQIDFVNEIVHINRLKRGVPSVHPLQQDIIARLSRLRMHKQQSTHVFISERNTPLAAGTVRKIVSRAGAISGIPFPIHPHMLRHACGFYLANKGHDTRAIQHYLGHRNIQHTVTYTELVSSRFNKFWID